MSTHRQGLAQVHAAVFLFGLSGLLGRMISAPPLVIVFGRAALAALALGAFILWRRPVGAARPAHRAMFLAGSGALLAAHWWAFFQAIQISTVALALLTFATFPLFVTFLEPLFFREQLRARDLAAALAVTAGLALVVPNFDFATRAAQGAAWGTLSGFTFAVLTVLNRKFAQQMPPVTIAAGQNGVAALVLLPWIGMSPPTLSARDALLILLLGLFCTALAHWMFIQGLAVVKARTAAVLTALEPVYGILLALFLLREVPSLRMGAGGVIILAATVWVSVRREEGAAPHSTVATEPL